MQVDSNPSRENTTRENENILDFLPATSQILHSIVDRNPGYSKTETWATYSNALFNRPSPPNPTTTFPVGVLRSDVTGGNGQTVHHSTETNYDQQQQQQRRPHVPESALAVEWSRSARLLVESPRAA
ncbi:hypothetical protein LZ554_003703 [Drepanopeziza brunnea f. sp. 'monogermtubi']|nr:hypothetical protein LZ554_003703 [Drepanopeziza brunnea f. sp. 'monogermtubi']